ncbi:MAG: GtrA family protein [Candidatus Margulisiibacteriota bacterium]
MKKTLYYAAFAALSIALNLGAQVMVHGLYRGVGELYLGLVIGTGVGLLSKYVLDKRFIFEAEVDRKRDHAKLFFLYSVMGVATTAVFWGAELVADWAWTHPWSRYIGGGFGLVMGYWIKYHLDRRFVFKKHPS